MRLSNATLQALRTNANTAYQAGYGSATPQLVGAAASTIPSSTSINTYGWMARLPKMRQWVGAKVINNLSENAAQITNLPFEMTVGVDRDDIADDNLGIYKPLFEEMGRQARLWPDQTVRSALQAGTSGLAFDGVAFFSNSHSLGGNTIDNLFASTALTHANYSSVRASMMSYLGDDGETLGVNPDLLIVPPQLETTGKDIIMNSKRAVDSVAADNVLAGTARLLVVPDLANEAGVWYLADSSKAIKPLVFQERESPMMIDKIQRNDDNMFFDREALFSVEARGAAGYGLYWLMARCAA